MTGLAPGVAAAPYQPSVAGNIPYRASVGAGAVETLNFLFTHPLGAARLNILNVLVNRSLDARGACYVAYSRPLQVLYLVNDQGPDDGLSSGLTLGSSGSVSNSQCTIYGAGSSLSSFGATTDRLRLRVSFKPSFAGSRIIYLAARGDDGSNSGWSPVSVLLLPEVSSAAILVSKTPFFEPNLEGQITTLAYQQASSSGKFLTVWSLINTALDGRSAC